MQKITLRMPLLVFLIIFLVTIPLWGGHYIIHLAILAMIGCLLSLGTNITFGYCGQINFGVIFMYAIGAYASALLQTKFGMHFFLALPVATMATILATAIVCIPLLRLSGHNLALGTFSLALVTYTVAEMWREVTGGSDGMFVPPTLVFQHELGSTFYYYFVLAWAALGFIGCQRLVSSRAGRAMMAIRGDEVAAATFGINVTGYKRLAFMVNGLFVGLAGCLFGQYNGFLAPSYFDLWVNMLIVVMIIVGGLGNNLGAVIGGVIIMLLPEALVAFKDYHILAYGSLLLGALWFMPKGVYGALAPLIKKWP